MTYLDKYRAPDRRGRGFLSAFLGDPSIMQAGFVDGGAYWIIPTDIDGNPWRLIVKTKGGKVPDWEQVARRNRAGYSPILEDYERIETLNARAQGIELDTSLAFVQAPTDPAAVQLAYAQLSMGGDPPSFEALAKVASGELRVMRFPFGVQGNPATEMILAGPGGTVDAGPAKPDNAAAKRVCRVAVAFDFTAKNGARIAFTAVVNPQLRMGYVVGFPGEVQGGANWLAQAVKTLVDVALIVVGAWSGNVGLVVSECADIVVTWKGYADGLAAAAAKAQAEGSAVSLGAISRGGGGGAGLPGLAQVASIFPAPLPTAGELARQRTAQRGSSGGGVVLLIVAALLIFGGKK